MMSRVIDIARGMDRGLHHVERLCQVLAAVAIAAMMTLVCADVMARELFSSPFVGNVEFIEVYLMPATIWFALPEVQRQGRQIRIEFVADRAPGWAQTLFARAGCAVIATVLGLIAVLAASRSIERWDHLSYESFIALPTGLPWMLIAVGAGLTALRAAMDFITGAESDPNSKADKEVVHGD